LEHLSSGKLGAFLANSLSDNERDEAERHLVSCAECRSDLVEAQRVLISAPSPQRASRQRWISVAGLAAAAVLLVAVWPRNDVTVNPPRVERTTPALSASVTIVSPAVNGEIETAKPTFTWNRDDGSSYRITVTDEGGRPLWSESTSDTTIVLPASTRLDHGARFFWYVDALRPDGRSITSGVNAFRTAR
jgi:hypothetical protein